MWAEAASGASIAPERSAVTRAKRSTVRRVSSPWARSRAIVGYDTRHSAWNTQNGACISRYATDQ